MKALRFYAPEDVRLEDQPEPECGSDEVKIRVRNCSTCGTDVKIFHNGHQNLTPPRTIGQDRKSTRLNSSHVAISYAVFCLKKKKKETKKHKLSNIIMEHT